jgi:hypothetical protein
MPDVQIQPTAAATQVEGFPDKVGEKKFQRSCKGALHIRPGSTRVITADELGFIRKHYPKLSRSIIVIASDDAIKAAAKQSSPKKGGKDESQGLGSGEGKDTSGLKEPTKGRGGRGSKSSKGDKGE